MLVGRATSGTVKFQPGKMQTTGLQLAAHSTEFGAAVQLSVSAGVSVRAGGEGLRCGLAGKVENVEAVVRRAGVNAPCFAQRDQHREPAVAIHARPAGALISRYVEPRRLH